MLSAPTRTGPTVASGAIRLRIVFNNVPSTPGLSTGWGFACVVEGFERTLLFDTGNNGDMLLQNMRRMGVEPRSIAAVVLSHLHADHMGGLEGFLARHPDVTVYAPAVMGRGLRGWVSASTRVRTLSRPGPLFPGVHSTGEVTGPGVGEQGLLLETAEGPTLITGCAHPGLDGMVQRARDYLGRDVRTVVGGFHLRGSDEPAILGLIARLKRQGVTRVAPSHCTGELATRLFRLAWGEGFLEGGCGAIIISTGGTAAA